MLHILISVLFFLLILSSVFSAGEISITAANVAKLKSLSLKGEKNAESALKLQYKKEDIIASILLGNTMANILSSSIAAFVAVELFGPVGVLISTFFITIFILLFAEILPKTLAIRHPEAVACFLSGFLNASFLFFCPLIICTNFLIKNLFNIFSISDSAGKKISLSEIIRGSLFMHKDEVRAEKNLEKNLEIITNLLDITEMHVDKIMTHRKDVVSICIDLSPQEVIKAALHSGYKKIPIWKDSKDNFLYVLDVERMHSACRSIAEVNPKDYMEKPIFTPELTPVSVQLHNFKTDKKDFAVVIDEYGNVTGIVTLSDIIEEILGEAIYTHNYRGIKKLDDGVYAVSGKIPVRDFNKKMHFNFPTEHNQTLAGMIIDEIERIPQEGESLTIYGYRLEIMKIKSNRIALIKFIKQNKK